MPKRIVKQSVVLYRDNKQVRPEIGKVFDFTTDELADLKDSGALAKIVKQDGSEETSDEEAAREQAEKAQKDADEEAAKKGTGGAPKAGTTVTGAAGKGGKPNVNDL